MDSERVQPPPFIDGDDVDSQTGPTIVGGDYGVDLQMDRLSRSVQPPIVRAPLVSQAPAMSDATSTVPTTQVPIASPAKAASESSTGRRTTRGGILGAIRRKRACDKTCFVNKSDALIKYYNLGDNALAKKYISKRAGWRHKCTPHMTQVPRYNLFKKTLQLRALVSKDARQVVAALNNYEEAIKSQSESKNV